VECCGERCRSPCHRCQKVTSDALAVPPTGAFVRTKHAAHPCECLLDCGHACGLNCARDHKCNEGCRQPCLRVCVHERCEKRCSAPCEPCAEACEWSCTHQVCALPCGTPCTRLPCDLPCKGILNCGHACPSICGEPCKDQRCPVCLSAQATVPVVNLAQKLRDIDLSSPALSNHLVSLDCGHLFTIEYLDRHYEIYDYYARDNRGRWSSLKQPPTSRGRMPPTCPSCAEPITARRYSRIRNWIMQGSAKSNVDDAIADAFDGLGLGD